MPVGSYEEIRWFVAFPARGRYAPNLRVSVCVYLRYIAVCFLRGYLSGMRGGLVLARHGVPVLLTVSSLAVLASSPLSLKNPVAKYYYFDRAFKKHGPVSQEQLQELAVHGTIGQDTPVESDTGDVKLAEQFLPTTRFKRTQAMGWTYPLPGSRSSDIGFSQFLTPTLITIIWWLSVITTIIGCLYAIGMMFSSDMPAVEKGISVLITIAIAVLSLLCTRIILELIAIFFRMERHQRTIKEILERNEEAAKP